MLGDAVVRFQRVGLILVAIACVGSLNACGGDDATPPTGDRVAGEKCETSQQCASGFCLAVSATRSICTLACVDDGSECPNGASWSCEAHGEITTPVCVCQANSAIEICGDGLDNDCDGNTDDCQICNGRVVPLDDRVNCGTCGNACPIGNTCVDGECECPDGECPDAGVDAPECLEDGDCNDDVECTQDTCVSQRCIRRVVPARCPSGEVCDLRMGGCIASRPCAENSDCEDEDPCTTNEVCDPSTKVCLWLPLDGDHDGDPPRVCGGSDCDDDDVTTLLGAVELCDGADNDCDGNIDDPLPPSACGSERACTQGRCECTAGTECGLDSCIDTDSDVQHCGICFRECPNTATCETGVCTCPNDGRICFGECTDPMNDRYNCGGCLHTCFSSESCVAGNCVDTDECASGLDDCDDNATCANTTGSFTCTCNAGFAGNGRTCAPDECAADTDNCDVNATCQDTLSGFTCTCNNGYSGNGTTCTDVNECTANTDGCDTSPEACVNSVGSFMCVCPNGYSGSGFGSSGCLDVNECLNGGNNCNINALCTNITGGFFCTCGSGYAGDGITCAPNATLSDLTSSYAALSPAFTPATRGYSIVVPLSTDSLTLTPTAASGIEVRINGEVVTSGNPSSAIALTVGSNVVNVTLSGTGYGDSSYVITVNRGAATYIKASNTGYADQFGYAVAVSGDTIVVGAPYEASGSPGINANQSDNSLSYAGAAYVFVRSNGAWTQQAYLKPSNPVSGGYFGWSVGVDGNTIVVGSIYGNNGVLNTGAAYVFLRSGTTWSQQAILTASNAASSDTFGTSVAISGNTVAVGATGEDSIATGVGGSEIDNTSSAAGAVYVFTRSGSTWTQQAYVKASNTGASDGFGARVVLDTNTLAVSALGEDSFATGINGNEADNTALSAGAVYVFARSGTVWTQQAYVKGSNTGAGDAFGTGLAVSGNTLAVGAPNEDSYSTSNPSDNTSASSGAAYVFTRSGTVWSEQTFLKAPVIEGSDVFGTSVALDANTLLVSATAEDSNATGLGGLQTNNSTTNSGAVHSFVRASNAWTANLYIKASNTGVSDSFGYGVAIDGTTLVIATPYEDSNATGINGNQLDNNASDSGAVYVY